MRGSTGYNGLFSSFPRETRIKLISTGLPSKLKRANRQTLSLSRRLITDHSHAGVGPLLGGRNQRPSSSADRPTFSPPRERTLQFVFSCSEGIVSPQIHVTSRRGEGFFVSFVNFLLARKRRVERKSNLENV